MRIWEVNHRQPLCYSKAATLGNKWQLLRWLNGEGNGTPLQYSCLENRTDGGAWWAAVHGVTKSWTRLSDFTFTFHFHALERKWQPTPVFWPGESQGRGTWWASVYGVSQSRTRLKRLSSSSSRWLKGLSQVVLVVKNLPTKAGDTRNVSSIPG